MTPTTLPIHTSTAPAVRPVSTHELVESFLSGKSPRTLKAYRRDLDDFREFVEARTLDEAAAKLLGQGHGEANRLGLAWRAAMLEKELSPATINRRLAALRSLVKLARVLGLVPFALEVPSVRHEAYRDTKGPGLSGFKLLLAKVSKRRDPKGIRDTAILRLLFDLALRAGEVCSLDADALDLSTGTLSVVGKGKLEPIRLSLPEATQTALAAWLDIRGTEPGPLFPNFDRAGKGDRLTAAGLWALVKRLGKRVGVRITPHALRHAAITEAVKRAQDAGIGLDEVLQYSRHADVRTLLIYRDCQGQIAGLVAAAAS